ncbi:MAG: UvrD-helicase domain-containing protein [Alphaproteobacteria bacterium]|nr:UvrD-helicase domain-containing protein [Alphaproteobacteria bacterium]
MNHQPPATSYKSRLNPEQLCAVETTDGPVLVLSGAGTGKTSVLVARMAHILDRNLARPWEILAVTFTNKAAAEMRTRVAALAPTPEWVGTFHSICLRILRINSAAAGLGNNFIVLGEDGQKAVLKTVITAMKLDTKEYPPADWVERISAIKDKGLGDNSPLRGEVDGKAVGGGQKIYNAYNAELARMNAVDFGDLILKVLELFKGRPDVLQKYQKQFKYIMVDEYQDTNAAQYQLLRMLAAAHNNICCVGDDDQSIYSWRGADIKNILGFESDYADADVIRLETNYRSTGNILGAANSLIRHNTDRLGKNLRASDGAGDGEKIRILHLPTDFDEARLTADAITAYPAGEVAVLIRAGSLSRLFEEEFARRGIEYKLVGATKFYDRMEIKDTVAYSNLLAHPHDDISFARVISKPRRGFGDVAVQKIRDFAAAKKIGMLAALREMPLSGAQKKSADEFSAVFDFAWENMAPSDAVSELLEKSGYMKIWAESKDADAPERLQNVRELISNVISKYDSLPEFLEHAALMMTDTGDTEPDASSRGAVAIMTIHAAKGLEFDTVFLPAWEEGIFPNDIAIKEGGIEEERRLAYVAITRAKRRAIITHTMSRMLYGTRQPGTQSRFIAEIDEEFIGHKAQGIRHNNIKPAEHYSEKTKPICPMPYALCPNMVGKLVTHAELGGGVVIEDGGEILTVAFKDKGIKKIARKFVGL